MYYIGIDGGGTKTLFSLFDNVGNLVKQHIEGTCHFAQVGYDGLEKVLENGIDELTKDLNEPYAVGLGLAGYGREQTVRKNIEISVQKVLKDTPYALHNDAFIALQGALDGKDGILVIAGTGSIAISLFDGKEDRSGGWGFAIGDEGSAYWIGRKILAEFSKQSDGRKPKTPLYQLVKDYTQVEDDADLISYVIKTLENKRENVAKFAMLCSEGANMNDENCLAIYDEVASEIVSMIHTLAAKVNHQEVYVSYTGGVWKSKNVLVPKIKTMLQPHIHLIDPIHTPDYGAYLYVKKQLEK